MSNELYTIGHSNHSIEKFVKLLKLHNIDVVCDVRSSPYSRHNPQFNREALRQSLKEANILYVFLGKELGARSDDPACYVDGKVQYKRLAQTDLFQQGLSRLRTGMDSYRVALMCAEKDPLTCHRTILVCHQLKSDGIDVKHILWDGKLEHNIQAEERLMRMLHLQPSFFEDAEEIIEQAYSLQAEKIAYVAQPTEKNSVLEEVEA